MIELSWSARSSATAPAPAPTPLSPEALEAMMLTRSSIDEHRLEALLQEAEDNGGYTEMTAQDWEDIERDGLAMLNAQTTLELVLR